MAASSFALSSSIENRRLAARSRYSPAACVAAGPAGRADRPPEPRGAPDAREILARLARGEIGVDEAAARGEMPSKLRGNAVRRALAKLIDEVFGLDAGIRSVAVYQDQYMLAGGMRQGRSSFDPEEEALDIDLQLARIGEIATEWQKWFGTLDGLALRYDRLNLAFTPLAESRFIVISTDPDVNPFAVLEKMKAAGGYRQLAERIP